MSRETRLKMVQRGHPQLSLVRQCALLGISRSSVYYQSAGPSAEDLELMVLMDAQYLVAPSMAPGG